uniref:DAGKc domain-containing protein n=1 Tax=Panagrolaimus sp. JU765 TaxID=591449 RepID=A0AC34R757_9BILA
KPNLPTSGPVGVDSPNGSVLVFVNPHSGAGKGLELFAEKLRPRLLASKLCYDLLITERPNHAKDVIKTRADLFTFDAIVIVSGDGLLFEILNGLLEREDGESLLQKLAFGMCPTGSGNGLLASVFHKR